MSETKHTPGPWRHGNVNGYIANTVFATNGEDAICEVIGIPLHQDVESVSGDARHNEGVANARLIAAAPDLLDHAKLFARTLEYQIKKDQRDGDDEGANLKAVTLARVNDDIAKAEGRS